MKTKTQEERSASTRRALLDATVACLAEVGYAGTTSAAVADRAGFSRGAQLHHFGSRDQLVVAAVEHLAHLRLGAVREQLSQLGAKGDAMPAGPEAALGLLAEALSGPLYAASLELWVAARADPTLREELVPAEDRVNAELAEICRTYVTDDPVEIRLTLDLLLGRGVSGLLIPHQRAHEIEALSAWTRRLTGHPRG
ncbi:TetR/AcrR family transcriptional regulator [Aeromicrobium sp.]|uniref:TetR/AcrR family transcriptional regulator n=1 Tax=Aeromicrobium sp. TaxID=1871063 RepID=UPI0025BD041B|nr:TetR/AcrR family transcriptional regulator [Aeromicrobium sp.]MCK5891805.1 TetR/AcrR family transcriptional regulator [Aeromicrobium sp.]